MTKKLATKLRTGGVGVTVTSTADGRPLFLTASGPVSATGSSGSAPKPATLLELGEAWEQALEGYGEASVALNKAQEAFSDGLSAIGYQSDLARALNLLRASANERGGAA